MNKKASFIIPTILIKSSSVTRREFLRIFGLGGGGAAVGGTLGRMKPVTSIKSAPNLSLTQSNGLPIINKKDVVSPQDIQANLLGRETYLKDPANKSKSTGLFGPNLEERTNYAGLKAMSQQGQDAALNKAKTFNTVRGAGMGSVLGLLRAGGSDLGEFFKAIARGAKDSSKGFRVKDYNLPD
jgi:hypothetical protein